MKILDKDLTEIRNTLLKITKEEARELASKVETLCEHPNEPDHIHVNNIEFKKGITVSISPQESETFQQGYAAHPCR